jgi:23S rRNA (cytosine1962-C5)-methyltransferase
LQQGNELKAITLKPREDNRIQNGHLWVFSNEIQSALKDYEPGEIVAVQNADGHFLGIGYVNPHSLISIRLLTTQEQEIDYQFFEQRMQSARQRRQNYYADSKSYRVVYGESDGLPGLVIDRYEDYFVVQSLTCGIERQLDVIVQAMKNIFSPIAIVARQDSAIRKLENLELSKQVLFGTLPEFVTVDIEGMAYSLDLLNGQKTGFFLDQKENHLLTRHFVKDKKVLDCFSYVGGWALNAARFGAREVVGLDSSESAIQRAEESARLNQLTHCTFKNADVFDELKAINDRKETFDVIILDPPAFAKSRAQIKEAIKGYREINRRAAKALNKNGILITCSCSHAVDHETFRNTVSQGILAAGRNAILLDQRTQAKDHPILMTMRETEYLKCLVLEIL